MLESITTTVVAGVISAILVSIGAGMSWNQIRKHGKVQQSLDHTKEERDNAIKEVELGARPPLTAAESVAALRKLRVDATK